MLDKTKIDGKLIGDIVVGSVLGSNSQRANEARIASLLSGIPDSVPIHTINRQCSSGYDDVCHSAFSLVRFWSDVALRGCLLPNWQRLFLNFHSPRTY